MYWGNGLKPPNPDKGPWQSAFSWALNKVFASYPNHLAVIYTLPASVLLDSWAARSKKRQGLKQPPQRKDKFRRQKFLEYAKDKESRLRVLKSYPLQSPNVECNNMRFFVSSWPGIPFHQCPPPHGVRTSNVFSCQDDSQHCVRWETHVSLTWEVKKKTSQDWVGVIGHGPTAGPSGPGPFSLCPALPASCAVKF